jgi:hypothetical protein
MILKVNLYFEVEGQVFDADQTKLVIEMILTKYLQHQPDFEPEGSFFGMVKRFQARKSRLESSKVFNIYSLRPLGKDELLEHMRSSK